MSRVNWQRTIDQILLTGTGGDDRILGLTSVRRVSGVSLVSRYLARTLAADQLQVLLLDLSEAKSALSMDVDGPPDLGSIGEQIVASGQGYDLLVGGSSEPDHGALVGLPRLRGLLRTEFANYARIVIDMPPVLDESALGVNSIAASAMCDRLLLVTRIGRDKRAELTEVLSLLRGAGVRPSALLANKFK
ncbi:MAG: hypothetical protein ACR2PA_17035 [Hyphomicrobiaceae bacterium]